MKRPEKKDFAQNALRVVEVSTGFTRLTNGFSRKFENHEHMLAIYYMYYNYCRVHQTLRVTPAMEAGIADHVWDIENMVTLLENRSILYDLHMVA